MKKTWLWTPAALGILAVGSAGLYAYLQPATLPEGFLYGNGRIEATEVRIGSEVAGRVTESRLIEGRVVAAGDLLVTLDETDLKLRLAQAEADRRAVEGARAAVKAEVETARHHLEIAEIDVKRYRTLRTTDVASAQRLDQAENALKDAQGRLGALEAASTAADAKVESAIKTVALLTEQIGKAHIAAPIGGTILVKAVEPGEVIAPGQSLAIMADIGHLELKVYIPERDIGKIKIGAPARIGTDAFPGRFAPAVVSRIDQRAQFTPRDIHMPDDRVRTVFGVTLAVENPRGELKLGMPVDAWIKWEDDVPWLDRLVVPR